MVRRRCLELLQVCLLTRRVVLSLDHFLNLVSHKLVVQAWLAVMDAWSFSRCLEQRRIQISAFLLEILLGRTPGDVVRVGASTAKQTRRTLDVLLLGLVLGARNAAEGLTPLHDPDGRHIRHLLVSFKSLAELAAQLIQVLILGLLQQLRNLLLALEQLLLGLARTRKRSLRQEHAIFALMVELLGRLDRHRFTIFIEARLHLIFVKER